MRFRLIFVLLGLACVSAGVTLVIQGELENREQEEVFATAQTKLYSSFEVFSEPEAKKPVAEIVKTPTINAANTPAITDFTALKLP